LQAPTTKSPPQSIDLISLSHGDGGKRKVNYSALRGRALAGLYGAWAAFLKAHEGIL
jgi:hypothetical protein